MLLLGVLQQLQRALLGRQRVVRPSCAFRSLSADFISLAAFGSASAILLNAGSTAPSRAFSLPTSSSTCSRSFACARLRKTTFSRNLSAFGLRLVADDVERRGDDLALLARQLADRLLAAAATAAAARLRLRRLVVLAERPDLHEVDVARRRLRSLHAVGVGRLRVVGDEVARLEPELFEIDRVAGADFRSAACAPPNSD